MASYCGTTDCRLICSAWGSMAGTDATAIIAEASAMVDAYLGDFDLAPPQPLVTGGTTYDFYVRRCTAHLAVWLAAESLYRSEHEVGAETWWDGHRRDAEAIIAGLRSGEHKQARGVSVWERGIGPAVPTANGTIAAPPYGAIISNSEVVGDYYLDDTFPRTFIVELDGTGTSLYGQTFRWMYSGGTAWEQEAQTIHTDGVWSALEYGVMITADIRYGGTALEAGQRWTIECNPGRQRNYKGHGLVIWDRKR